MHSENRQNIRNVQKKKTEQNKGMKTTQNEHCIEKI